MGDVVPFKVPERKSPHIADDAVCANCGWKWMAVLEAGTNPCTLECSQCHAFKGYLLRYTIPDAPTWHCLSCEGIFMNIQKIEGIPCVSCCSCGAVSNALDIFS